MTARYMPCQIWGHAGRRGGGQVIVGVDNPVVHFPSKQPSLGVEPIAKCECDYQHTISAVKMMSKP